MFFFLPPLFLILGVPQQADFLLCLDVFEQLKKKLLCLWSFERAHVLCFAILGQDVPIDYVIQVPVSLKPLSISTCSLFHSIEMQEYIVFPPGGSLWRFKHFIRTS